MLNAVYDIGCYLSQFLSPRTGSDNVFLVKSIRSDIKTHKFYHNHVRYLSTAITTAKVVLYWRKNKKRQDGFVSSDAIL